jgi:pimeloyl-ACP methyl ester carboxylesterase
MTRSLSLKVLLVTALATVVASLPQGATGQAPKAAPPAKGAPKVAPPATKAVPPAARAAPKAKGPKAPEPEEIKLETRDGWAIHATYFPGTLKKQAVPFIMLHGWNGQRSELDGLALLLQSLGHAVICPDLRGHGQSNVRPIIEKEIEDADDLTRADIEGMVRDVEACKKFLKEKNNLGELNLESLAVVAADVSCIVALQWSALDWSAPQLASYKNGQDVKALFLLSPRQSHKGVTREPALRHPAVRSRIAIFMAVGTEDSKSYGDTKKLNTSLENFRPDMKKKDVPEEDRTIKFVEYETNLSGTDLLNPGLQLPRELLPFVKYRLVDKQSDFEWTERKNPLEN